MKRALLVSALSLMALTVAVQSQTASGMDPSRPPVGSNLPPVVRIVSPPNGAVFVAPANVFIAAQTYAFNGQVASVEFFEGTNSLGVRTSPPASANNATLAGAGVSSTGTIMNPFSLIWSNVATGRYVLSAVATPRNGAYCAHRQGNRVRQSIRAS